MSSKEYPGFSAKKLEINSTEQSEVSKFYHGKSIFITGAAGFLGVVSIYIYILFK